MSINNPQFPVKVWDGTTPTRNDRQINAAPSAEDWDQVTAEMIAMQIHTDLSDAAFNQATIADLTDSTGGTDNGVVAMIALDTPASASVDMEDDIAHLVVKINDILAKLRLASIILT